MTKNTVRERVVFRATDEEKKKRMNDSRVCFKTKMKPRL